MMDESKRVSDQPKQRADALMIWFCYGVFGKWLRHVALMSAQKSAKNQEKGLEKTQDTGRI
jgi:hypothetical protein